jgi:raffinose/stachyose/melibiose transport system permease protein
MKLAISKGSAAFAPAGRQRMVAAALFLAPATILYLSFTILPLLDVFTYSTFRWEGIARMEFVGLDNFKELATQPQISSQIANAFKNNWLFFLGTMLVQNTVGLGLAVLLFKRLRVRRFFQTVIATPFLVNPLVVGYVWILLLNPTFGPIAIALRSTGLGALVQPWLGDPVYAQPLSILINAWQWVGFPMLVFGAALAMIPEEINQAATIDGANSWQLFRHITLPLLTPAIGTITVLTFIGCFNAFNLQYALGGVQGGPAGANDVLGLVFYRIAYGGDLNSIGSSSALATCMFLFVFTVAILLRRMLDRIEAKVS